jgi:hypothetical protein
MFLFSLFHISSVWTKTENRELTRDKGLLKNACLEQSRRHASWISECLQHYSTYPNLASGMYRENKTVLYYGIHIHHLSAIHTAQQCSKLASFCVSCKSRRQAVLCKCEMSGVVRGLHNIRLHSILRFMQHSIATYISAPLLFHEQSCGLWFGVWVSSQTARHWSFQFIACSAFLTFELLTSLRRQWCVREWNGATRGMGMQHNASIKAVW